jgi:hypothetical protein
MQSPRHRLNISWSFTTTTTYDKHDKDIDIDRPTDRPTYLFRFLPSLTDLVVDKLPSRLCRFPSLRVPVSDTYPRRIRIPSVSFVGVEELNEFKLRTLRTIALRDRVPQARSHSW